MAAHIPNIRRTSDIVDIEHHRRGAAMLRDQHTCNLMRGATVTTWTLAAGTVLLLAVIAFVPRNSVNPGVASSSAPVAVALTAR